MSTTDRGRAIAQVAILLLIGAGAGSCGNLGQYTPACAKLSRRPAQTFAVEWIAPKSFVRRTWSYRHNAISVGVREPEGLTMGIGHPYYLWCRFATAPELEAWSRNARILRDEFRPLERIPESYGEMLIVNFTADSEREIHGVPVANPRYAEVDDLTPDALEAARRLSCLASEAFGDRAQNAILELTPTLATRVGFPQTCVDEGAS